MQIIKEGMKNIFLFFFGISYFELPLFGNLRTI